MAQTIAKFDAILDGFEFVSAGQPFEHQAFLCKASGEVHCRSEAIEDEEPLPADIDEPGRYIAIPHKNDLDLGKALVLKFIAEALPDAMPKVQQIFNRPGAYARFKDLLEFHGKLQQWYDYEKQAQDRALRAWCKENELNIEG